METKEKTEQSNDSVRTTRLLGTREIKFRQPLTNNKDEFTVWHYWGFIDGLFVAPAGYGFSNKETAESSQQFTGLKDKNGKEIYEGDVVHIKGTAPAPHRHAEPYDVDEDLIVRDIRDVFRQYEIGNAIEAEFYTEIIGNIFENPELIECT